MSLVGVRRRRRRLLRLKKVSLKRRILQLRELKIQRREEREMKIDELTIGEAKDLARLFNGPSTPPENHAFKVGNAYYIRTVTYHLTGRVTAIIDGFLVLEDAAWVAESGRYFDALKTGKLSEVEPVPDGTLVSIGAVTDASPWNHPLPKVQQ